MHRLFVAIRPPEDIRDRLIDIMEDCAELRWVPDDNLHLTLRFIGEVERPLAKDIAAALGAIRFPAFELQLSGIGSFDRRSGGALWAGVDPRDQVAALAGKVERACQQAGVEPERRAFHPHITLARWKGRRTREVADILRREGGLTSPPFAVYAFTLFESQLSRHGAHYEEVGRYPLTV